MKEFLFISLAVIQFAIGFIPNLGKLNTENPHTNSNYKLTFWGKALFFFTFLGVILTIIIYFNSENESSIKNNELKNERLKSDSIISVKVDSSRKVLFNDLSEALNKQMLKLDTVNNVLVNLKVSTSESNNTSEDPTLFIHKNGVNMVKANKGWDISFEISALGASLTNFNIKIYYIFIINNERSFTYNLLPFTNYILVQNTSHTTFINHTSNTAPASIFIRIKGNFTKANSSKVFYEDRIFRYMPHNHLTNELYNTIDRKKADELKKALNSDFALGEKENWEKIFDKEIQKQQ